MSQKLKFNEEIISTAAEPISSKDLLLRLSTLQEELSNMDQSSIDLSSLESIKDDLINKKLLKNTNLGIQILVSCCLSDILRLFAPNAPYNNINLLNIFKLFINQFAYLTNVDSSYYNNYIYLLERVAEIELIALLTDLDNCEKLLLQLFETFYNLSNNVSNDHLESLMVDILGEVISEVNQLDLKILKLILNKFLVNSKNLKNQSKFKVPGFNISLKLCELNSDKMSRLITYFFSEMILQATNDNDNDISSDSDSDDENKSSSKRGTIDIIQLKKIHNLAIELWRYVPEVLTSVLGLLDNELEAEDLIIRSTATDTVSNILSIYPSRINFSSTYTETYMNWLKKPLDISFEIRICWLNGISKILENRNDLSNDLINGILKTLMDSNEKVRYQTIIELSKLKPETFLNNILNNSLSNALLKLLREKNPLIRNEIIYFLSTLYNYQSENNIIDNDNDFIKKIPNNILELIFINDLSINATVDLALFEKLLPFSDNPKDRVNKLLKLISILNHKSLSSFWAIMKRQTQLLSVLLKLLTMVENNNEDDIDDQINNAINWLSKSFPSSYEAESCLKYFFNLKNKRLIRLMILCSNKSTDYDTIVNSIREILNRINEMKLNNEFNPGDNKLLNKTNIYNTIKLLLLRSSNIFYNIDNIYEIIIMNNKKLNDETCKLLLNNISEICPIVLESNIKSLINSIINLSKSIDFEANRIDNDCYHDLKIIYNYYISNGNDEIINNNNDNDNDNEFHNCLFKFSINGSPKESKYSIKLLNKTSNDIKTPLFTKIVNIIWPLNIDSIYFNTHLSTLSTLFQYDILSVDTIKEDISKYLATYVLLKNTIKEEEDEKDTITWIDDRELYYNKQNVNCLSKILTMKLLTNWLVSINDDLTIDVESVAKPILSMLSSYINRGGEIVSQEDTPENYRSRLRLHAGYQILKLSKFTIFNSIIDQRRINRLILLIQDSNNNVRLNFINKIKKKLTQHKLNKKLLPLLYFVAFEPDRLIKESTSIWIRASYNKYINKSNTADSLIFEKSFITLIHMIFNHPEFKELFVEYNSIEDNDNENEITIKAEKFEELAKFGLTYIIYFLSLIVTSENISVLFYLTQRIKQYKGKCLIPENSEKFEDSIYILSELTEISIKFIGKIKNWSITVWPGKINLPIELFDNLDDLIANNIIKKTFINEKYFEIVDEIIKHRWKIENGQVGQRKVRNKSKSTISGDSKTVKRKLDALDKELPLKKISRNKDNNEEYVTKTKENDVIPTRNRSTRAKRINYNEN